MKTASRSARSVAISIIARWLETKAFPDRMIPPEHPEHGFILDLVYGTVRWKRTIAWAIRSYVKHQPSERVYASLMLGTYQLLLRDDIPEYAAINETVDAVRALNNRKLAGFVNAVLRAIQRDRESLMQRIVALPLGLRYSHPDALVDSWSMTFGADIAAALCVWDNTPPGISLTCRPDGPPVDELLRRIEAAGIDARPHLGRPDDAIEIPHGNSVEKLFQSSGISTADCVVQDPATLHSVELLDVKPGQRVLDACAAPGGKTVQLAARLGGRGELVATELHADRIPRLRSNVAAAGVSHLVRIQECDASNAAAMAGLDTHFDRILLDVPCSNTGVLRRRPDARWRYDPRRLKQLNRIQRAMLTATAPMLHPGGLLAYSTCSLLRRENDALVNRWLRAHPEYELLRDRLIVPTASHTDGAYTALIRRRTESAPQEADLSV